MIGIQMGKMTPPSRKSCYNFRVTEIVKVVDGDTIDVVIDLGFDIYKHERVRIAGIDTPEKRTRDLEEKALGIDATNWMKGTLEDTIKGDDELDGGSKNKNFAELREIRIAQGTLEPEVPEEGDPLPEVGDGTTIQSTTAANLPGLY